MYVVISRTISLKTTLTVSWIKHSNNHTEPCDALTIQC